MTLICVQVVRIPTLTLELDPLLTAPDELGTVPFPVRDPRDVRSGADLVTLQDRRGTDLLPVSTHVRPPASIDRASRGFSIPSWMRKRWTRCDDGSARRKRVREAVAATHGVSVRTVRRYLGKLDDL
jgi:hypothetical protein